MLLVGFLADCQSMERTPWTDAIKSMYTIYIPLRTFCDNHK